MSDPPTIPIELETNACVICGSVDVRYTKSSYGGLLAESEHVRPHTHVEQYCAACDRTRTLAADSDGVEVAVAPRDDSPTSDFQAIGHKTRTQ